MFERAQVWSVWARIARSKYEIVPIVYEIISRCWRVYLAILGFFVIFLVMFAPLM